MNVQIISFIRILTSCHHLKQFKAGIESLKTDGKAVKFRRVLKYCPKPCNGKKPCIRTCICGRGFMSNEEGRCEPMTEEVKLKLNQTVAVEHGW